MGDRGEQTGMSALQVGEFVPYRQLTAGCVDVDAGAGADHHLCPLLLKHPDEVVDVLPGGRTKLGGDAGRIGEVDRMEGDDVYLRGDAAGDPRKAPRILATVVEPFEQDVLLGDRPLRCTVVCFYRTKQFRQ